MKSTSYIRLLLISQTTYRNDIIRINIAGKFYHAGSTVVDMLFASQLYFKKSITTIPPMKNGVTFKPITVSIMEQQHRRDRFLICFEKSMTCPLDFLSLN